MGNLLLLRNSNNAIINITLSFQRKKLATIKLKVKKNEGNQNKLKANTKTIAYNVNTELGHDVAIYKFYILILE